MRAQSRRWFKVVLSHHVLQKAVPVDSPPNPFLLRDGGLETVFALGQDLRMSRMHQSQARKYVSKIIPVTRFCHAHSHGEGRSCSEICLCGHDEEVIVLLHNILVICLQFN